MSHVNISSIEVLSNPAEFTSPLQFRITFECLQDIPEELEWKVVYVGSSKDPSYDQVLDSFSLGPLEYGVMQFDLESNPPDWRLIPKSELLGVTAVIITVTYRQQEFFRIGYYVYNNYVEPELLESPPDQVILEKVVRNILVDKPRITKFDIKWGDEPEKEEGRENTEQEESTQTGMLEETSVPDNYMFMNNAEGGFFGNNPFLATTVGENGGLSFMS